MTDLAARLLAIVIARTTPLTQADAAILMNLAAEIRRAVSVRGVRCPYGREGDDLCVPDKWSRQDRTYHAKMCAHCPVFRKVRGKRD